MHYTDPHFSIHQQVSELLSKGLSPNEKPFIEQKLHAVPYCRLKQYWTPLHQTANPNQFQAGVTFEQIWPRHTSTRKSSLEPRSW